MTSNGIAKSVQPALSTADVERLISFYSDLFGAGEYLRVPGKDGPFYVGLRLGAGELGIVDDERGAKVKPGRVTVSVLVEAVDDLLPKVEPAGGTVLGPAKDMPWGQRVAHITDPDGNTINLTQQL